MRWFARRLAFYAFALWAALTINFLLPRLMPGDPIGGLLQHLTPAQVAVTLRNTATPNRISGTGQRCGFFSCIPATPNLLLFTNL